MRSVAVALSLLMLSSLSAVGCKKDGPGEGSGKPFDKAQQQRESYPDFDDEIIEKAMGFPSKEIFERVSPRMGLKEGMVVGDIGCGPGNYTYQLAKAVGPTGKVYAIDVQQKLIDLVRELGEDKERNPYGNVELVLNTVDDTKLPEKSLDVAVVFYIGIFNYPQILPENERFLASIARSIKDDGRLFIRERVDFGSSEPLAKPGEEGFGKERQPTAGWTGEDAAAMIRGHIEKAGFELIDGPHISYAHNEVLMNFRKTGAGQAAK